MSSETVKTASPPSSTVTLSIEKVAESSSVIVPVAVSLAVTSRVPSGVAGLSATLNVSVSSTRLSSVVATLNVWATVDPAAKVTDWAALA